MKPNIKRVCLAIALLLFIACMMVVPATLSKYTTQINFAFRVTTDPFSSESTEENLGEDIDSAVEADGRTEPQQGEPALVFDEEISIPDSQPDGYFVWDTPSWEIPSWDFPFWEESSDHAESVVLENDGDF